MRKLSHVAATAAAVALTSCANWQPVETKLPATPQAEPQKPLHPNREAAYVSVAIKMKAMDAIGRCETACYEHPDNIKTKLIEDIAKQRAEAQFGFDPTFRQPETRGTICEDFVSPSGIFTICCAKACKD